MYCFLILSYISNFIAPPSLPELDVSQVMEDNETVNVTLTPPSVSPECVLQYNIITYSNCESIETNITVDPNNTDPTQPVQLTRSGLNLCTCSYNFTAAAVTRNGTGERSDPVTIKISGKAISAFGRGSMLINHVENNK